MADNLDVTPGTGKTVAADEVGGALHQRVKISIGADGEAADLDSGQKTMANSVPVTLASDQANIGIKPEAIEPNGTEADQRLTVDSTAGGVQFSAFHAVTEFIFWTSEDADCRVTFDNSAPTTTNGHLIVAGSSGVWPKAMATAAKFIRTGATSAVIHASQMKAV